MEITGRILQILPLQEGTNKNGNPWRKQEFVIETESQYPKKVLIMLWGDKVGQIRLQEGSRITAHIVLESREYNGRWYTEVRAWKVVAADDSNQGPPESFVEPDGDMPF